MKYVITIHAESETHYEFEGLFPDAKVYADKLIEKLSPIATVTIGETKESVICRRKFFLCSYDEEKFKCSDPIITKFGFFEDWTTLRKPTSYQEGKI